ncbi:hypothetical protein PUMCH_005123 [Australozyma saopauloensis]|uniref:Uncharacterized protein n=1 Tax=Australozyma saopauloensis TaxID=291208 RepID=A0AAX4HH31_9ASCO|nr:hypothetical protein PUMCH_005123 [[Candida] saopauloensis]
MSNDNTESFLYLSPDPVSAHAPRIATSVEKTQNLLNMAEAMDLSHSYKNEETRQNSRKSRGSPGATKQPSGSALHKHILARTGSLEVSPGFLNHSTPVAKMAGGRPKMGEKVVNSGRANTRTVSAFGSPSSDDEISFGDGVLRADSQLRELEKIVGLAPKTARSGLLEHLQVESQAYLRRFLSGKVPEHRSKQVLDGILDLDLLPDQTFDHPGPQAASPGTTPPSSRGMDFFVATGVSEDRHKPLDYPPIEPIQTVPVASNEGLALGQRDLEREKQDLELFVSRLEKVQDAFLSLTKEQERKIALQEERIVDLENQVRLLSEGSKESEDSTVLDESEVLKESTIPEESRVLRESIIPEQSKLSDNCKPHDGTKPSEEGSDSSQQNSGFGRICPLDPITAETLLDEFKSLYQRLHLELVDEVSDAECRNVLKCVMLSLAFADFDHLPAKSQQLGVFLQLVSKFLDLIHGELYGEMSTKPLDYLYNYEMDVNDGLKECLAGMTSLLTDRIHGEL